jgi:integrase
MASPRRGKLQEPKTSNSTRALAISPNLVDHLRRFIETSPPNANNLLFPSSNGTPLDQNLLVKRKLRPLLERLNIQRCGLHVFRHFAASMMDRLNTPLKLRQQRLGHSGAEMTLGVLQSRGKGRSQLAGIFFDGYRIHLGGTPDDGSAFVFRYAPRSEGPVRIIR